MPDRSCSARCKKKCIEVTIRYIMFSVVHHCLSTTVLKPIKEKISLLEKQRYIFLTKYRYLLSYSLRRRLGQLSVSKLRKVFSTHEYRTIWCIHADKCGTALAKLKEHLNNFIRVPKILGDIFNIFWFKPGERYYRDENMARIL